MRSVFFKTSPFLLAAAMAVLGAFGASAAEQRLAALPAPSAATVTGGVAKPLPAWLDFCRRYPFECQVDLNEPAEIELTPQRWAVLNQINAQVNRAVRPLTDMEHWGVADRWDFPEDGYGDCEDYQLMKRHLLVRAGFPRRAMLMTVVLDENNQGHAVLTVRTNRGDIILDNQREEITAWQATPYVYIKREAQTGATWVSLERSSGVQVTAAQR